MPFDRSRLKALRKKRRMSLKELGKRLGIHYQQIQEYERGDVKPGADRLEQLVNALDTNMDFLMARSNYDGVLTDLHQQLAEAFDRGDQATILDLIRQKALKKGRNKGGLPGDNPPPKI
jgi:transcriptional regulator with XRE-family HTH domain